MTTPAPDPAFTKERVGALTDGIFAIVMTLLVLELKVPPLPRHVAPRELLEALGHDWTVFFSFFVTFMLAAQFWMWHHALFHYMRHLPRRIGLLHFLFLMFVSLLPFSTAMLGSFNLRQPVVLVMYFGNQFAISAMLLLVFVLARRGGLFDVPADDRAFDRYRVMTCAYPAVCLAAVGAALVVPGQAFNVFTALLVLSIAGSRRRRRATAGRLKATV